MKLATISAIALAAHAASAGVITETDSVTGQFQPLDTLEVDQFAGNPADLAGVELTLNARIDLSHQAENTSPNGTGGWDFTTEYMADIFDHTGSSVISFDDTFQTSGSLGAFDGNIDFDGASGVRIEESVSDSYNILLVGGTDDLSAFIGTGTVEFDIVTDANGSLSQSGAGQGGALTTIEVDVETRYLVNEIPAPGSVALLAMGTLVGVRRRR